MEPVLAGLVDLRIRSRLGAVAFRRALISDDLPVLGTPTTMRISGSAPPGYIRGALPPLNRIARADSVWIKSCPTGAASNAVADRS
eukprot:scaffold32889_cov36-Tisochrysis_lutea.AAC.2